MTYEPHLDKLGEITNIGDNFSFEISYVSSLSQNINKYQSPGKFVYVFLNYKNEVLYVGKTNNLFARINRHYSENKIDDWNRYVYRICFYRFDSETDQTLVEIYLINDLQGKYNISSKQDKPKINIPLAPFESITYPEYLRLKRYTWKVYSSLNQ